MNAQQVKLPQPSDYLTKLLATAGLTNQQQKYLRDFIIATAIAQKHQSKSLKLLAPL
jgi:hypothetical protein